MDLEYWHERDYISRGQETFLVQTTDVNPETWPAAASAIRGLLLQMDIGRREADADQNTQSNQNVR